MDNQTLVHPYNGIRLSNKMEHIPHTYSHIGESQLRTEGSQTNKDNFMILFVRSVLEKAE